MNITTIPIAISMNWENKPERKIETNKEGIERKNAMIAYKKQYNKKYIDSSERNITKLVKAKVIKLDKEGGMTISIISNEEKTLKLEWLFWIWGD